MKHLIRLAGLLGLLILTGCPKPPQTDNVLLHLAFDGSLHDSSVNNFSATASDTVKYTRDRFGRNNHAIVLRGDAVITVPNTSKLDFKPNSEYSISLWIRTRDTAATCLIAKGASNVEIPGYSLQLRNGRPTAIFTGTTGPIIVSAPTSVADNVWHLLTLSVSPDSINLYTDTTLVASGSGTKLAPQQNKHGNLIIGSHPTGQLKMKGAMDGLFIRKGLRNWSDVHADWKGIRAIALDDMPPGVTTPYQGLLDVSWVNANLGFACGTGSQLQMTTDGVNWNAMPAPSQSTTFNSVSFYDQQVGALVDKDGKLYVTNNGGNNWALITTFPIDMPDYRVRALHYYDLTTLVLGGSDGPTEGGPGFVAKINVSSSDPQIPNTQPVWEMLESNQIGEVRMITVISNAPSTRVIAFGSNGEAHRYELFSGNGVGTPIPLPNYQDDVFQSADIIPAGSGYSGLAGTRDGRVFRYTEPSTPSDEPWSLELSIPNEWVIGVSYDQNNAWAVSSGPIVMQKTGTGGWSPTNHNVQGPAFISKRDAAQTFVIENGTLSTTLP